MKKKPGNPTKKRVKTFLIVLSAFLCLTVAGSLWQYVKQKEEWSYLTMPGKLYNINSHQMHLYGIGEGENTVVFTTGSGTPCAYTDYYNLQDKLKTYARTVSYDRPGFGWSENTKTPRDIGTQVEELHELLQAAGETPPFILVGHSLASLEVLHYAQSYPEEVKGIVLLDGGNPDFYTENSETLSTVLNRTTAVLRATGVVRAFGKMGILFPFVGENVRNQSLPDDIKKVDRIMYSSKIGNKENLNAIKNMNENAGIVLEGGYLKDIPLIILSSVSDKKWNESQKRFTEWSNLSEQETLAGADHYIHWTNEDIVVNKIMELINQ